ncbi:hypothetical protein D3C77_662810 [compost metagenome]
MLGLECVGKSRRADSPGQLAFQILLEHRDPHAGIGLGQVLRVSPVIPLVQRPDVTEQLIVWNSAFEHLDNLATLVVARTLDVRPGGGDDEHQRLPPGAHAGEHGVVLGRAVVLVEFVDDRAGR